MLHILELEYRNHSRAHPSQPEFVSTLNASEGVLRFTNVKLKHDTYLPGRDWYSKSESLLQLMGRHHASWLGVGALGSPS